MSLMGRKYCAKPGCGNIVTAGRWCAAHATPSTARPDTPTERATPYERGYTMDWRRLSKSFRQRHPDCDICGKLADVVHHITPIADGGARLDERNLRSLCHACHAAVHAELGDALHYAKSAKEDRGGPPCGVKSYRLLYPSSRKNRNSE
jgi:5-methylcytosine-specific restriction protein A